MYNRFPLWLKVFRFMVAIAAMATLAFGVFRWMNMDLTGAKLAMHPEFLPLHVPVAASSLMIYLAMGACGILTLIKLPYFAALGRAMSIVGVFLTFITLVSGSFWGKVTWGTWWQWGDPRLMTMLILFFLYLGYIAACYVFDNPIRRDQSVALLGIVGAALVPVIYFSTKIWDSIHQDTGTRMTDGMKAAFLPMLFGIMLWAIWMILLNFEAELKADKKMNKMQALFEGEED